MKSSTLRLVGRILLLIVSTAILTMGDAQADAPKKPLNKAKASADFIFDKADVTTQSTLLEDPLAYDADIAIHGTKQWHAWLKFTGKQGDRVWVGSRRDEKCSGKFP